MRAAWPVHSVAGTSESWQPAPSRRPTIEFRPSTGSCGGPEASVPSSCRVTSAASGGVAVEVLAPVPERAVAAASPNDLSLVVRVTVRGLTILFTGDLGADAEARLLSDGTDLRADVLKVPHHGSGDADPDFLAASGARVGLISVSADNTYGHPTQRTLTWLAQAGMRVHRTDREGDLAVVGSDDGWGIAARGRGSSVAAASEPVGDGLIGLRPTGVRHPVAGRNRRRPVTPCRRAGPTRGTDLSAARRDGGGGTAAVPSGQRR